MARRDVGTTYSADMQDRSNCNDSEDLNSLAAEGWVRYTTNQVTIRSKVIQLNRTWEIQTTTEFKSVMVTSLSKDKLSDPISFSIDMSESFAKCRHKSQC